MSNRHHLFILALLVLARTIKGWQQLRSFSQMPRSDGTVTHARKWRANQITDGMSTGKMLHSNVPEPRLQGQLQNGEQIVVLDFNNLRGKDNFKATSTAFMMRLASWAAATNLAGAPVPSTVETASFTPELQWQQHALRGCRVVVVVDHGLEASALEFGGMAVVFAGPNRTADDVIAATTRWLVLERGADVLVSTSDRELAGRCNSVGLIRNKNKNKSDLLTSEEQAAVDAYAEIASTPPPRPMGAVQVVASQTVNGLLDFHIEKKRRFQPLGAKIKAAGVVESFQEGELEEQSLSGGKGVLSECLAREASFRSAAMLPNGQRPVKAKKGRRDRKAASNPPTGVPARVDVSSEDVMSSKSAAAVTAMLNVISVTNSFKEKSWHRVLAAEIIRRALLADVETSSNPEWTNLETCEVDVSSIMSEYVVLHNDMERSRKSKDGGAAAAGGGFTGMEGIFYQKESGRKGRPGRPASSASSRRSLPTPAASHHPLLFDHRLRHDSSQKKAMRIFIAESFSSSRATAPPSLGVEPAASDNYANSGEEEPVGLSDAPGQVKENDAELGSNGSVHSGVAADEGKQELVTSEGAVEMEAGVVLDADTTPIGGSEQWMSNSKWGSRRSRIRRKKMVVLPSTPATTKPQALLATDDEIEAWLSNKESNQGTAAV